MSKVSKNVSEIKSFLGLLNCCHRHFQGFTDSVEAHHNLLKKEEKWGWQEQKKMHLRRQKKPRWNKVFDTLLFQKAFVVSF